MEVGTNEWRAYLRREIVAAQRRRRKCRVDIDRKELAIESLENQIETKRAEIVDAHWQITVETSLIEGYEMELRSENRFGKIDEDEEE